ncbi:hypothetical protein B0T22DRAFT_39294 [Podospora appendiculata]|uniref:Uncharacterized protein n=1 Tax=Podospora appendiculata TaxID=314037 RepID=A0AAE0XHK5_9PEZI|nr:hypothetical protein B0T22DRAFT_39294 [Podospora appendiculata]
MAVFDPIEYQGIAFDRDIIIRHDSRKRRRLSTSSSIISFGSVEADEDNITCRPWFSPASPGTALARRPSPSHSFLYLIPEDLFANRDLDSTGTSTSSPNDRQQCPNNLTPLKRFARLPERHEMIALSMAPSARCALPYQDYMPCPGSEPGSAALSVATETIRPVRPTTVDVVGQTSNLNADVRASAPLNGNPTADRHPPENQSSNWLALVLQPNRPTVFELGPLAAAQAETPRSTVSLHGSCASADDVGPAAAIPNTRKYDLQVEAPGRFVVDEHAYTGREASSLIQMTYDAFKEERVARTWNPEKPRSHKRPRLREPLDGKRCKTDWDDCPSP